ncbi:MAG: aminoacetone oxidase family FAD-binding enzyme [Clostridia bacterium]|nr:aminoacetone oxidase family FAD-binding enzyme [Clostridia bacterium]
MTDVVILGGGAAGLSLGVMLKSEVPEMSVTLLERSDRVGKKLATTGNGRCNITNIDLNPECYHGESAFAADILSRFGYDCQKEFFKNLGVLFTVEDGGKVYPKSLQAASVVDALRFRADELGVNTVLNSTVTEVKREGDGFAVICADKTVKSRVVVVAAGGQAGGRLGSTDGYCVLKSMGHKIERVFPSVVQLKTESSVVRQLKGVKVDAVVKARSDSKSRVEFGEVLFCDYGLSGPPILQVSRLFDGGNMVVSLDLLPDMTEYEVKEEILRRSSMFKSRVLGDLFVGMLHKRLGQVVLKCAGADLNSTCGQMTEILAVKIAKVLKSFDFKVTGNTGFENAQVTAGGAQCAQFFPSCMSKKAKGLFAVGEVLNVDGDCGGFNLAFAWGSANAAKNGIIEYLKQQN